MSRAVVTSRRSRVSRVRRVGDPRNAVAASGTRFSVVRRRRRRRRYSYETISRRRYPARARAPAQSSVTLRRSSYNEGSLIPRRRYTRWDGQEAERLGPREYAREIDRYSPRARLVMCRGNRIIRFLLRLDADRVSRRSRDCTAAGAKLSISKRLNKIARARP
jgi:hypothetical protein